MNQEYLKIGVGYRKTHMNLNPDRYRKHNASFRYASLGHTDFQLITNIHIRQPFSNAITLNDRINDRGGLRMYFRKA